LAVHYFTTIIYFVHNYISGQIGLSSQSIIFVVVKNTNNKEENLASFWVYFFYYLLLGPFTLIILINKIIEPLSPNYTFTELEKL
jgi:hypothetical protein